MEISEEPALQETTGSVAGVSAVIVPCEELESYAYEVYTPWNIILCQGCQTCVPIDMIASHTRDTHKEQPPKQEVIDKVKRKYGLASGRPAMPQDFGPRLDCLETVQGKRCSCGFKGIHKNSFDRHFREKHSGERKPDLQEVTLQTFYPRQVGGYIAVVDPIDTTEAGELVRLWKREQKEVEKDLAPGHLPNVEDKEQHPFLMISNWAKWLEGMEFGKLEALQQSLKRRTVEGKHVLEIWKRMWENMSMNDHAARCVIAATT